MKKLLILFSVLTLCSCDNSVTFYRNIDDKLSELRSYHHEKINDVINELTDEDFYVVSNQNGAITMSNYGQTQFYYFSVSGNNMIYHSTFEYRTQTPTVGLNQFGKWHNKAVNFGYDKNYYAEIAFLNGHIYNYRNEGSFMDDFENYGADILSCYEEWLSRDYGISLEYNTANISNRSVSVSYFDIQAKAAL